MSQIRELMQPDLIKWLIPIIIFSVAIIAALLFYATKYKKNSILTPYRILFAGTLLSACVYFFPIYKECFSLPQTLLLSLQHALRLFALEGDFREIVLPFEYPDEARDICIFFGAVLYTVAPLLTFSFILSFFKNLTAHLIYSFCFLKKAHIFSELNEKSLALAKDILKNQKGLHRFFPDALIVFTDIVDKKEEASLELLEDAREIGAILFRKDLESVKYKSRFSLRRLCFYLISDDESEKIRHAKTIMEKYDYRNVELRVFSASKRLELLLAAKTTKKMKIERVNDIQSLIYHHLDVNGINLFRNAYRTESGKNVISAVIIGLGRYGCEMLKALTWYCQHEDYIIKITAFDTDPDARKRFEAMCPELLSTEYNKVQTPGDAHYEIDICPGINVAVPEFEDKLSEIKDATYIFVCLGDDELNLDVSAKIRAICERSNRNKISPDIETVIYNTSIRESMGVTWEYMQAYHEYERNKHTYKDKIAPCGVTNHSNDPYNILMFGDLEHFYSEATIIDSELVEAGKKMHIKYCIDYAIIGFTEKSMEDKWKKFLKNNNLTDSWNAHIASLNYEDKYDKDNHFDFTKAKKSFSFMQTAEQKAMKNGADADILNTVAERINSWEIEIFNTFYEDIKDLKTAAKWQLCKKEALSDAEASFRFEYNFRSSVAKAMHRRLREMLAEEGKAVTEGEKAVAEEEKAPEETIFTALKKTKNTIKEKRTALQNKLKYSISLFGAYLMLSAKAFLYNIINKEDNSGKEAQAWYNLDFNTKVSLGTTEHIRWNAYMRSEGYRYKANRNNLAKQHNKLVPVTELTSDDLRKDA